MTDKEYLMTLKSGGLIKGAMPFLVNINNNSNYKVFKSKRYIVSYRGDNLYLESVGLFNKMPNHKDDLTVNINDIKKVAINDLTHSIRCLFLYVNNRSIGLCVGVGYNKSAYSENNLDLFIKLLKQRGVKGA